MKTILLVLCLCLGLAVELAGCEKCLQTVNAIRAARGLPLYRHSPRLTRDAEKNASYRAKIGWHGKHLPGHRQVPRLNGIEGCEGPGYGRSIKSNQFYACGVFSNGSYRKGYVWAGAAKARDKSGRVYCTLRLDRKP